MTQTLHFVLKKHRCTLNCVPDPNEKTNTPSDCATTAAATRERLPLRTKGVLTTQLLLVGVLTDEHSANVAKRQQQRG
jgi:hypothetical protein